MSSDDENWQSEAKQILTSELQPLRTKLDRIVQTSPALSAARSGAVNLAYSAVGAIAGAALSGDLTASLVGATGGKGAEVIVSYIRGLRKRREGKALLDLVLSFYPA